MQVQMEVVGDSDNISVHTIKPTDRQHRAGGPFKPTLAIKLLEIAGNVDVDINFIRKTCVLHMGRDVISAINSIILQCGAAPGPEQ